MNSRLYTSLRALDGVLDVPPVATGPFSLRNKLIVPNEFISERRALDDLGRLGKMRDFLRCELEFGRRRLCSTKLNDSGREVETG